MSSFSTKHQSVTSSQFYLFLLSILTFMDRSKKYRCGFVKAGIFKLKVIVYPHNYISTSMTDKTVEQKIKECKELIIQNMEKAIQHKMVYMFLKDRKKEAEVKQYSVNAKDGIIKMEFVDHERALAFYNESNFNDKILIRPFNIYFNLTLSEGQMKKYYLEGITEENQRNLFEIARKIGICKLYTSYGIGTRGKLKSTGLLSYIRKDEISEADFKLLTEELKAIGIKIFTYVQEKGTKVSLNLINFISDQHFEQDENQLHDLAESKGKEILEQYVGKVNINHLSVIARKKEIIDPKNQQNKTYKVLTSALFEFESAEEAYKHYEKIRIGILNQPNIKVRLFFHNQENNSYLSLITQGLFKDAQKTEKQFEEELIQSFRQVNKNVLQVNVFPVSYNNSYIGRVYLTSEEEGKNFIVDYSAHRSKIYHHYREKLPIFNITIDTKTLRKLKQAEKKAKETEDKIKKQTETSRRDNRRTHNVFPPLPPNLLVGGINPMMSPLVPPTGMMMPPMGGIPPMGDKGLIMPPPSVFGRPPTDLPPHFAKAPMPTIQPANVKFRLASLIRDKKRFLEMDENSAKRGIMDTMRLYVEDLAIANGQQAVRIVNEIIKSRNVQSILGLLQKEDQFRDVASSIKNNQH